MGSVESDGSDELVLGGISKVGSTVIDDDAALNGCNPRRHWSCSVLETYVRLKQPSEICLFGLVAGKEKNCRQSTHSLQIYFLKRDLK